MTEDTEMEPYEDASDVAVLLRRAASEAPTGLDRPAGLDGAMRRGRRLRRRRQWVQGVGALAVVATVATGVLVAENLSQAPSPDSVALAPTTTPTAPTPSPSPTAVAPAPRGDRSVTAVYRQVLAPYGEISGLSSYPYAENGIRAGTGMVADASGPGSVTVNVTRDESKDTAVSCEVDGNRVVSCQQLASGAPCPADHRCLGTAAGLDSACPPAGEGTGGQACEVLDNGTVVMWQKVRTYSDARDRGEYSNEATAYRADGLRVHVAAYNGAGEKLGKSRETPSLDLEQVRVIAGDPAWADVDLGS